MVFILSQDYVIQYEYDLHKIIFVFSILSYAIIDIIRVVLIRLINRKSPFEADKNHIHHLIFNKTNSHIISVAVIILFQVVVLGIVQSTLN